MNVVRSGGFLRWLRWYGTALTVLIACLLGGLALLLVLASLGLDPNEPGDDDAYTTGFLYFNLFLPFTATVYLVLFALLGRWGRRPRVWAFVLLPILWGVFIIFAVGVWFPPVTAMWLSLLAFATFVELPPYRERRPEEEPGPTPRERPLAAGGPR